MASTKKGLTARVAAGFGAVALATLTALGGALPASAAPNIDPQEPGSITIHKFEQPVERGDVGTGLELGMVFRTSVEGRITAIRFYKGGTQNSGPHVVNLWGPDGTLIGSATTAGESARGWQSATLPAPVPLDVDTTYTASYWAVRCAATSGRWARSTARWTSSA